MKAQSGKHSAKMIKDLDLVVMELLEWDVFNPTNRITHASFSHLKTNPIKTLEEDKLKDCMVERFSILVQPDFSAPPINSDSENDKSL